MMQKQMSVTVPSPEESSTAFVSRVKTALEKTQESTRVEQRDVVSQFLHATADVLERDGWVRGFLHEGARHCTLGAMEMVMVRHDPNYRLGDGAVYSNFVARLAVAKMDKAIKEAAPDYYTNIVHWNDSIDQTTNQYQTQESVVAMLREVADK